MGKPAEAVPTPEEMQAAAEALEALAGGEGPIVRRIVLHRSDGSTEDNRQVSMKVSASLSALLVRMLTHLADGHGALLLRKDDELTTQQSADLLNVSRPYLVKLLDEGAIPHHMVGTHRRVRVDDLMAYRATMLADADEALDELAADAQELGLGY